jgi:hypothetical protein
MLIGDLLSIGLLDVPGSETPSNAIEVEMHLGQSDIDGNIVETLELSRHAPRKLDWHVEVSLAMPVDYNFDSPDGEISLQMLQLLSNPFVGLFVGAYTPVITSPRVFTSEVRLLTAMMRPVDHLWRLEIWQNCFDPQHGVENVGNCPFHKGEVASIIAIMTGIAGDLLGNSIPRKLGKLMAQIFVHGCGVSAQVPLTVDIITAEPFREAFLSVFPVEPLFSLFTPDELVDVFRQAMVWYPGKVI